MARTVTIPVRLNPDREQQESLLGVTRRFSSCVRFAFNRLLEGEERNVLKRTLPSIFGLNTRYIDDAILQAQEIISSSEEIEVEPRKVIFGGKSLFKRLNKKHLSLKKQEAFKERWFEKRKCNLYSRGDTSKDGNLNLRFVCKNEKLYLRVNIGERKWLFIPCSVYHKRHLTDFYQSYPARSLQKGEGM